MVKRLLGLLKSKVSSLYLSSIAITSRVEYSKVSKKAKIWHHAILSHSYVDDYSYIGPNTRLIFAHVGKYCSIGGDCKIGMGTHSLNYASSSSIFTSSKNGTGHIWTKNSSFDEHENVIIGHDVWIGQNVLVIGGVKIGTGAVIGAGAVVTKDVEPYSIVGGVPAKVIRKRFSESVIKELLESEWWQLDDDILKKNIKLFQEPLREDNLSGIINLRKK